MRNMKQYISFLILSLTALASQAQKVTFFSPAFEQGVREHLQMTDSVDIQFTQVDTITAIDLSRRNISDLRDVVYLPHVRQLDLSGNTITDVEPLAVLDSLSWLDIGNNLLESIDILAFTHAEKMWVNVADNYISDFSLFFYPLECQFTLRGMSQQIEKDAPFFDIYNLYSDIGKNGSAIAYRAYTNMDKQVYLKCGTAQIDVVPDGTLQIIEVPDTPKTTSMVLLTNGEQGDTTYIVPPAFHVVDAGKTIEIDTELPKNYQMGYVNCMHGTAKAVENKLQYTAPEHAVADTLYFAFYEGSKLRGFSQFYLAKDPTAILPTKLDTEKSLRLTGDILNVRWRSSELAAQSTISVYDPSGKQIASKQVDSTNGIETSLSLSTSRQSVLIVQVVSGQKKWIEKLLTKEAR